MRKVFWNLQTIIMVILFSASFVSCSDDEENLEKNDQTSSTISEKRLLANHWTSASKAPSFTLYSNGKCTAENIYWSYNQEFDSEWAYDADTKVLAIGNVYALTIKVLTSKMLSAEWADSKGARTDSWTIADPLKIDENWKSFIDGKWKTENGYELEINKGKFSLLIKDASDTKKVVTITGTYQRYKDNSITLTSDKEYNYTYWSETTKARESKNGKVEFYIPALSGTALCLKSADKGATLSIAGVKISYKVGTTGYYMETFYYQ